MHLTVVTTVERSFIPTVQARAIVHYIVHTCRQVREGGGERERLFCNWVICLLRSRLCPVVAIVKGESSCGES